VGRLGSESTRPNGGCQEHAPILSCICTTEAGKGLKEKEERREKHRKDKEKKRRKGREKSRDKEEKKKKKREERRKRERKAVITSRACRQLI